MSCQNPHNHQVAAVFDFTIRLASHPFLHPLISTNKISGWLRFLGQPLGSYWAASEEERRALLWSPAFF